MYMKVAFLFSLFKIWVYKISQRMPLNWFYIKFQFLAVEDIIE